MWSHSVTQQGVESHHHATTPLSANFTQTQTMNDAMYVASPAQAQRGDPYHNWDTTQARTYSENVAGKLLDLYSGKCPDVDTVFLLQDALIQMLTIH